ncbi:MAG TPA: restriction endonuclease subunit S [Xanthomarina sp.]|nr:restriction endonuclease subunit S [Xanthomarina sp.]
MSFLDKLLEGVEVEWKTVDEIFNVKNGYTPSKKKKEFWQNGDIPWFRLEDIRQNGRILNTAFQQVTKSAVKGDLIPANSLFMSTTATIGEHALVLTPFLTNQQITSFSLKDTYKEILSIKFMFHYFFKFSNWCKKNANKNGSLGIIGVKKLKEYKIPIPCPNNPEKSLEIQQKIVDILDTFTELTADLTADLTAELTARKQQYDYYREQLLTFDETEVEHVPMGDESVGVFIRGGGLQKKDFTDSGVGCIHYGQVYTHYGTYANKTKSFVSKEFAKKARIAKHGDLVIATTSENDEDLCKAVAWLGNDGIAVSSDACFYRHNLNPKYVAYFFQTEQFHKQKRKYITGAKVRRVNASKLELIKIPIPSLKEQQRIVNILDKFDTLTTSISEGLPKEIELRKKQYEYYREMLLSFPNQNNEA